MGFMQNWTGAKADSKPVHYGGHNLATEDILKAVTDGVTPSGKVNWTVETPTVLTDPTIHTLEGADMAERQADLYDLAVERGCRVLKAEGRRQMATAKLVKEHRKYLGTTAQAHFEIASANRGLAGKLHGLREGYAQIGHSLDRKSEEVTQKVEMIAAKYKG